MPSAHLVFFSSPHASALGCARAAIALAVLVAGDAVWFALTQKKVYAPAVQRITGTAINLHAWFVVAYVLLCSAVAVHLPSSAANAALYGSLVGLVVYGTLNALMASLFRGWTWPVALADTVWGTLLCAAAGAVTYALGTAWHLYPLLR